MLALAKQTQIPTLSLMELMAVKFETLLWKASWYNKKTDSFIYSCKDFFIIAASQQSYNMANTSVTAEAVDRENGTNYTPLNAVGTEDGYSEELSVEVDPALFLSSFFYAFFHPLGLY